MKVDAFPVIPRGFLDLGWIAGGYLTIYIPVVPHKAVAEVSKIGNL